jgi:DNA-binding PucR family transcriptional regulator
MTAQVCGLKGAYDIGALGVRAAVATDTDVGAWLQQRYLEPLQAGGSARESIETLRAYLASGMHVGRTAERLFIHQNTVRYRLGRFEKLTDTSLLDAEVLVELWWVLELSTMRL